MFVCYIYADESDEVLSLFVFPVCAYRGLVVYCGIFGISDVCVSFLTGIVMMFLMPCILICSMMHMM